LKHLYACAIQPKHATIPRFVLICTLSLRG
jgi:hypothetical protein